MSKVILKIDLNKVDMSKVVTRKYTNSNGQEVEVRELSLDLVNLKEPKFVKEFSNSIMKKIAFLVEPQTKEQREKKEPSNFVGDGFVFESKEVEQVEESSDDSIDYPDEPNPEDIPF